MTPGPSRYGVADRIVQDPELLGFFRTLEPGSSIEWVVSHVEHAAGSILRADNCRCLFTTAPSDGSFGDRAVSLSGGSRRLHRDDRRAGTSARRGPRSTMVCPDRRGSIRSGSLPRSTFPGLRETLARDPDCASVERRRTVLGRYLLRARALAACAAPALESAHARAMVAGRLVTGAHEAEWHVLRPDGPDSEDYSRQRRVHDLARAGVAAARVLALHRGRGAGRRRSVAEVRRRHTRAALRDRRRLALVTPSSLQPFRASPEGRSISSAFVSASSLDPTRLRLSSFRSAK